jgi:predicted nucleic acid-binding protein
MKKLQLYLDTSVLNFAISNRANIELQITSTKALIERIKGGDCDGYISERVVREIERASQEVKALLFQVVDDAKLRLLETSRETEILAEKYVSEGLIPQKYYDDAVHIAIATVNEIDIIVSWNFEHMVKVKTKKGVVAVNELMGYRTIEIVTPQEVD